MSRSMYAEIPAAPDAYSSPAVLARLMDGLGYRYYWATEGLSDEALNYRPEPSCRSLGETLNHVHDVMDMLEDALTGKTTAIPSPAIGADVDVRSATLGTIERTSTALRTAEPGDLDEWKLRFDMGGNEVEFPFWYAINGMMSDALYHTGQVVAYRRAAGEPMNPKVNVFMGNNPG